MNMHAMPSAVPRTWEGRERRAQTQEGREARERYQVLAELAELLRSNPFLAAED